MKVIKDNETRQISLLKLFNSVEAVESNNIISVSNLIKNGIIVVNNDGPVPVIDSKLADIIIDTCGINNAEWTNTFHKSWDKVANASIEQLVFEQIVNYYSTYVMESIGFKSLNYIPVEDILVDLDATPSFNAFQVIRMMSSKEVEAMFIDYLSSTKAPHKDNIKYIEKLLKDTNVDLDDIASFEIKIMYCDMHDLVPVNAQDFLRYAVYIASNKTSTTLIKDDVTIDMLKKFSRSKVAEQLFESADLVQLSKSFYRFKPLFLAFKSNKRISPAINKIRRLAKTNHKPVSGMTASNIMNLLMQNHFVSAIDVLSKADNRTLVKLINFSNCALESTDHLYNIRNGSIYVKAESENIGLNTIEYKEKVKLLHKFCVNILSTRINLTGLTFYIPEGIEYAVPVSEKQMLDKIPFGTKIMIPEDAEALCISGHWFNQEEDGVEDRVDLDFHMNSMFGSVGWNSSYRNDDVLYSGDMTDAPKPLGAVESFRIAADSEPYQLSINTFTYQDEVDFELLFTKDVIDRYKFNCTNKDFISATVNTQNALAPKLNLTIHNRSGVIGYYANRSFTVYGGTICGGRNIPNRDLMLKALSAAMTKCDSMMKITDFITSLGGKVVRDMDSINVDYIDLSIDNINTRTLFDLVDAKIDNLPVVEILSEDI